MKKIFIASTIALTACLLLSPAGYGQEQQKLAQTGMKFLNVGTDARSASLGDAVTAFEGGASSMFYNPAGMSRLSNNANISFGQTQWIADIKHLHAAAAFAPLGGAYGVFGVTLQTVDYGDLQRTVRADNTQGFLDMGTFQPTALALGVSYARALSDRFSIGGSVKYVNQNLGDAAKAISYTYSDTTQKDTVFTRYVKVQNFREVAAFDFGVLYHTGYKSLTFGMAVRNFAKEIKFQDETFQLPLIFKIGLAMDALDFFDVDKEMHSLLVSVDATHPRDYPEQFNVGLEYSFMKMLALRGSYLFNNSEYNYSLGIGLQKSFGTYLLGLDYSYTPFKPFDPVHRFTFQFSL